MAWWESVPASQPDGRRGRRGRFQGRGVVADGGFAAASGGDSGRRCPPGSAGERTGRFRDRRAEPRPAVGLVRRCRRVGEDADPKSQRAPMSRRSVGRRERVHSRERDLRNATATALAGVNGRTSPGSSGRRSSASRSTARTYAQPPRPASAGGPSICARAARTAASGELGDRSRPAIANQREELPVSGVSSRTRACTEPTLAMPASACAGRFPRATAFSRRDRRF